MRDRKFLLILCERGCPSRDARKERSLFMIYVRRFIRICGHMGDKVRDDTYVKLLLSFFCACRPKERGDQHRLIDGVGWFGDLKHERIRAPHLVPGERVVFSLL